MNPGMSALLRVTDVHISYGKVEAVRAVSLDVFENEIVTIVGANGAGKTTLLNAIMGILPLKGRTLSMQLGFSHDVDIPPPDGITFATPKQTEIKISGIDKQLVGEMAARIRRIRPPEPYKGKGVRYQGETVRRKEGKKK